MFLFKKRNNAGNQAAQEQNAPAKRNAEDMKNQGENIKNFIAMLKKQHDEGLVSEETFRESLAKNEEALKLMKKGAAPAGGAQTQTREIKKEPRKKQKNGADIRDESPDEKTDSQKNPETGSAAQTPEKTVGEILKEEGVIHDEEKTSKITIEREVDLNRIVMDIEKLAAEVEALRNIKFQSDERIKEIAESIGEMRSLIFQRDGAIKEAQMKIEKLEDAISDIKPEKIAKELKKRERETAEQSAKVEKVERMGTDMALQIKNMQKILENIKSMENLAGISREIEEKLLKMEELKTGTERDAEKSEKMYLEIERRTREFAQTREAVARLDELTKELLKGLDEDKIKMAGLASREEVQKALDSAMKLPAQNREDKIGEKRNVESLLKSIETQYRKGIISKESYEEVSGKNKELAQFLDKDIRESETKKAPQTILEWMAQTESGLKELELKLSLLSGAIKNREQRESAQPQPLQAPAAMTGQKPADNHESENKSEIADIKNFLSELENHYREGLVSEGAFEEARRKNLARLRGLEIETPENHVPKKSTDEKDDISEKINRLLAELER
ncbi:MAG: hypothetical protein KKB25_02900 [Nanoarchaeota archaeon]|nr:hypothetical protein [Nanoarchaeota archaeon]